MHVHSTIQNKTDLFNPQRVSILNSDFTTNRIQCQDTPQRKRVQERACSTVTKRRPGNLLAPG